MLTWHAKPVKTNKPLADVVASSQIVNKMSIAEAFCTDKRRWIRMAGKLNKRLLQ